MVSEVWDKGNEAAVDELLAPDAIIHSMLSGNGEKTSDVAAYKTILRAFRLPLSEVRVTIEHEVTDGVLSAARCLIDVVPKEKGAGHASHSKPIHFTGLVMIRERDGRIVELWNHFDFETMYQKME